MTRSNLCGFLALLGMYSFASESNAQLATKQLELEQPLTAMVKFSSWMEVFENDFDLEVTVHYGGADGGERLSHYETICKCRQVYDRANSVAFTPWAIRSVEIDVKQGAGDLRERKVRVVEGGIVKEKNFLEKSMRSLGRCKDECLRRASPVNLMQSVSNFKVFDLTISESDSRVSVGFMERLASLRPDQLTTKKEKVDDRAVLVYRIKGDTLPKSVAIPVHRIVVSDSGFDSGQVIEIHSGAMMLGDKSKYENESQLIDEQGTYVHKVRWKEVSLTSKDGGIRKLILPVSVSKKQDIGLIEHKGYFNMELIWQSFTGESQGLCSVDACDKISEKFLAKIDSMLGR